MCRTSSLLCVIPTYHTYCVSVFYLTYCSLTEEHPLVVCHTCSPKGGHSLTNDEHIHCETSILRCHFWKCPWEIDPVWTESVGYGGGTVFVHVTLQRHLHLADQSSAHGHFSSSNPFYGAVSWLEFMLALGSSGHSNAQAAAHFWPAILSDCDTAWSVTWYFRLDFVGWQTVIFVSV